MAYAVLADIVPARIPQTIVAQLTDDSGNGQLVQETVTKEIAFASGIVDSYCRQRYTVPLQSSLLVKGVVVDLAVFMLYRRKDRVSETVQKAYDQALSFLKDIAAGRASLDQPTGATAQGAGGEVKATEVEEKFSDDNLKGFV